MRALENRVYTVTANRTGTERRGARGSASASAVAFTGRSQVVDPDGIVVPAPAVRRPWPRPWIVTWRGRGRSG